jgi:site-specific recombinase XerD
MSQELFPDNPLKKMAVSPKVLDDPKPSSFPEVLGTYELLKRRMELAAEGLPKLVASRNLMVFHLIYGGGLKVSDMAKLRFSSILKDQKNFRVMVEHPKRDPYSVPLPPSFSKDFNTYKTLYLQFLKQEGQEIDELLFNANPYRILSGGLSPRGTELFFEEIRREQKTEITAKSLRQSCIFKWLNQNVNHTTIKEWLGVTPGYSLELYLEELRKDPTGKVFQEIEDDHD